MSIRDRAIDNQLIKPVNGVKGWKQKTKLIDLQKELAKALNIPFADLCCEEGYQAPGGFPVRYQDGELQGLNPDGTWSTISIGDFLSAVTYDETNTVTLDGDGTEDDPLQVNVRISTDTRSSTLFSSDSTGLFLNSPKLRDAQRPAEFPMLSLPKGELADGFNSQITKSGALASATFTKDGDYDKVAVVGGDVNSYFTFGPQTTMANMRTKLKVLVNSIEATPLLGFRGIWPGGTFSNFNNTQPSGYVDLTTGAWTIQGEGSNTNYNGVLGTVSAGDIIEITQDLNHLRGATYTFAKLNNTNGEVSTIVTTKSVGSDGTVKHAYPAIIMAGGDYTILDASIYFLDAQRPKILTVGDSMSVGVRIAESASVTAYFKAKQPYEAANIGAGSVLITGMLASIWQVIKLRPEYLVIFNFLDPIFYGRANPASGDYATWTANFQRYVSIIKSFGVKPIFVHPETWTFLGNATACAYYETFLNATYPSDIKIKVLNSEIFYDGTGFHYAGPTNTIIADKVIAAIIADGGI